MREDGVVAARLRSVLAATDPTVRGQAATADPPRAPTPGDLAVAGGPLRWSDVIPAWPDDVDLDPLPAADALDKPTDPFPSHLGDLMGEAEPFRSQRPPGIPATESPPPGAWPAESLAPGVRAAGPSPSPGARPLSSPFGDGPEDVWAAEPSPGAWAWTVEPEQPSDAPADGLSGAGAFGNGGRRGGLAAAFDPGRRGVRALAAVALLAIVVAAVFAWRARPRVDPVAPPSFTTMAPDGASGGSAKDGPAVPRPAVGSAAAEVVVAVGGKVRKPGLVHLPPGSRVADALAAAGGPDPGVDVAMLNLARKVVDGELIMVGVTPPPGAPAAPGANAPAGGPLNLNTATLADLDGLPGVGPVLAQRILDARDAQGGFRSVSDLRKVDGIGDARYEQLKDLVTV